MTKEIEQLIEFEYVDYKKNNISDIYNRLKNSKSLNNKLKNKDISSFDKVFALILYITPAFANYFPRIINNSLRFSMRSSTSELLVSMLDRALITLPPHNDEIVFRMVDGYIFDDINSQILIFSKNKGKLFVIDHFLSTSKITFGNWKTWEKKMVWEIRTNSRDSNARDLKDFSLGGELGELEVLFQRGSVFKIEGLETFKENCLVKLSEVSNSNTPSLIFKTELVTL